MLRYSFPKKGERYKKVGTSDGWLYHVDLVGSSPEDLFNSLRNLLDEEGYSDIPLPANAERLWWDYLHPESFSSGKYIYHPLQVCKSPYRTYAIEVHICNENHPKHKELWQSLVRDI